MVGTMHGTHEDIEQEARMRNKRVTLVDYNNVFNIKLEATEVGNTSTIIEKVIFILNDYDSEKTIEVNCCVSIPTSLYMIFEADYYNKLQIVNRNSTFKNLIDFINKGH